MKNNRLLKEAKQYEYSYGDGVIFFSPRANQLSVNGQERHLEPRSAEILSFLMHQPRAVLPLKDWLDAGSPQSFDNAVSRLRKQLGELGSLVRTVKRQGYVFEGDVTRRLVDVSVTSDRPALRAGLEVDGALLAEQIGGHTGVEVWRAERDGQSVVYKFAVDERSERSLESEASLWALVHTEPANRRFFPELRGTRVDERPKYLALDHRGLSLDHWGADNLADLTRDERIDLVRQIIRAVRVLHRLDVVHRDLKPSNLLIEPVGKDLNPLVIDLGSARKLDREVFERHRVAAKGLTVREYVAPTSDSGTLSYAAPEIQNRLPGDSRSDVFSIGVILYQAIVGDFDRPMIWPSWPEDIDDPALVEVIRNSTHGHVDQRANLDELESALGNLDERRQSLVIEARVQRYETQRPWIRAAGAILVAALTVSSYLGFKAREALTIAQQQERQRSDAISFITRVLEHADPRENMADPNPSLVSALYRASDLLDDDRPPTIETRLTLSSVLAQVYRGMGQNDRYILETQRSLELATSIWGDDSVQARRRTYELVSAMAKTGDPAGARVLMGERTSPRKVDDVDDTTLGYVHEMTLGDIATAEFQYPVALTHFELARARYSVSGDNEPDVENAIVFSLAQATARVGKLVEALELTRDHLSGANDMSDWQLMDFYLLEAQLLGFSGQPDAAVEILERELPRFERVYGSHSVKFGRALSILAQQKSALGNDRGAIGSYRRAKEPLCDADIGEPALCQLALGNLGVLELADERVDSALGTLSEVYETIAAQEPASAVKLNYFGYWLATAHLDKGSVNLAKPYVDVLEPGLLEQAAPGGGWTLRAEALRQRMRCYVRPSEACDEALRQSLAPLVEAGLGAQKVRIIDRTPSGHVMEFD